MRSHGSPERSLFDPRQDLRDLLAHPIDRAHPVYGAQIALAEVVADQRRRLAIVDHEAPGDRLGRVVLAAGELGRLAHVAHAPHLGALEAVVIALAALGAGEAADDALDELVVIDLELDHGVEPALLASEHA